MSLWQFRAAIGGWLSANSAEAADALSPEDVALFAASMDAVVERSASLNV